MLAIPGEKDEILYNVKQPFFLEHALIEGVKCGKCYILMASILHFPFHESIQARSDSACFICRKVTDHANGIVIEHRGYVLHVIPDLIKCILSSHFIFGRTFQLHQDQRQTIYKENNIRSAVITVLKECELVHHIECIVFYFAVIYQANDRTAFLAFNEVFNSNAILQIIHENTVLLDQTAGIKVLQFGNCLINSITSKPLVNPYQTISEHRIKQRTCIIPVHIRSIDMEISHIFK